MGYSTYVKAGDRRRLSVAERKKRVEKNSAVWVFHLGAGRVILETGRLLKKKGRARQRALVVPRNDHGC